MRRALFACLLISLITASAAAPAGPKFSISALEGFANLLQAESDNRGDPPRRLRELRLKEAIRKGDLSPDEAKEWRRNKRQREAARPDDDERHSERGRSHWRDTQRRVLEDR